MTGADMVTVTKNEILTSLNKPDDFILAIVEFLDSTEHRLHYLRRPFQREPNFGVMSVNYDFAELVARAESPHRGHGIREGTTRHSLIALRYRFTVLRFKPLSKAIWDASRSAAK